MTREAFDLSEQFGLPVMIRLVTRLSHSRSAVEVREPRPQNALQQGRGQGLDPPSRRTPAAASRASSTSRPRWSASGRLPVQRPDAQRTATARSASSPRASPTTISARAWRARPRRRPLLKVSTYPLPEGLIRELVAHVDTVLVARGRLSRSSSGRSRGCSASPARPSSGKLERGTCRPPGELSPDIVRAGARPGRPAVAPGRAACRWPAGRPSSASAVPTPTPSRPSTRPSRGPPGANVFSDIGCYTLGALPPYNAIHSCVCMGASVSMARGAADAGAPPGRRGHRRLDFRPFGHHAAPRRGRRRHRHDRRHPRQRDDGHDRRPADLRLRRAAARASSRAWACPRSTSGRSSPCRRTTRRTSRSSGRRSTTAACRSSSPSASASQEQRKKEELGHEAGHHSRRASAGRASCPSPSSSTTPPSPTGSYFKQAEVHGMAQRGGAVQSHLRLSDAADLERPHPQGRGRPDPERRAARSPALPGLPPAGRDRRDELDALPQHPRLSRHRRGPGGGPPGARRSVVVDAEKLAKEAGTVKAQNIVMLGAAAPSSSSSKEASLLRTIEALFRGRGDAGPRGQPQGLRARQESGPRLMKTGWTRTIRILEAAERDGRSFLLEPEVYAVLQAAGSPRPATLRPGGRDGRAQGPGRLRVRRGRPQDRLAARHPQVRRRRRRLRPGRAGRRERRPARPMLQDGRLPRDPGPRGRRKAVRELGPRASSSGEGRLRQRRLRLGDPPRPAEFPRSSGRSLTWGRAASTSST